MFKIYDDNILFRVEIGNLRGYFTVAGRNKNLWHSCAEGEKRMQRIKGIAESNS